MKHKTRGVAATAALAVALAVPAGAIGAQPTCFPPGKANSPACDAQGQKGSPTRTDDGPRPFDK